MIKIIRQCMRDEGGAVAIEYGLIAAFVAVGAIAALTVAGDSLASMFATAASAVDGATPGG